MTQSTLELVQSVTITSPFTTQFKSQLAQSTTQSSEDVKVDDLKQAAKPVAANIEVVQSTCAQTIIANAVSIELQLSKEIIKQNAPSLIVHSIYITHC
jgi:hypothetical protein